MTDRTVQVSIYQKAKKNNYYCGDSFFYAESENEFICALADGLGSGEFAKESSEIVIDIIRNNIHTTVEQLIMKSNKKLMGKRGVVLGILKINFKEQSDSFSSIGNIGIMTVRKGQKRKRNIPNSGYLAGYHRPFKVVQEKLEANMNFIMFSDGVLDKDLARNYFFYSDVQEITKAFAANDGGTREDDTTLIALKYNGR